MRQTATLGGGCFWCLEAAYQLIDGVETIVSGYAGGAVRNPSYAQVCSGTTGHAEVVQLSFDPEVVTFSDLLDIFFTIHDPTTLNRQGADVGTQYRSVIFYHDEEQNRAAREAIARVTEAGVWRDPIVTEVAPLTEFYPGERYHQEYYQRNPSQPYCQVVIAPKLAKLRKQHFDRLRRRDSGESPPRDAIRATEAETTDGAGRGSTKG
jgi:peptide-methionine (S)-S-oxide reductase